MICHRAGLTQWLYAGGIVVLRAVDVGTHRINDHASDRCSIVLLFWVAGRNHLGNLGYMVFLTPGFNKIMRDPMPNLGRMMVFVDGENLVCRFEAMIGKGREAGNGVAHKKGVYVWLPATVRVGLHIVSRATYYTYATGNDEKLRKISEEIKALGFRQYSVPGEPSTSQLVRNLSPKVFKKPKGKPSGKGVDIQMTLDILSNVYQNNLDTVYLVSGDGDFRPVIEECIRFGKHVKVAALSSGLNPDLPIVADQFIDLDGMYFSKQSKK